MNSLRSKVELLQEAMLGLPQEILQTKHHFADGLYARELFIPKGMLLVGKVHKKEHLFFITKGDISVMTEDGIRRIVGPELLISKPGIKRAGYAHEDTVCITVHRTDNIDLEDIETELCEYDPTAKYIGNVLKLEHQ
jgi:hypothetical protein